MSVQFKPFRDQAIPLLPPATTITPLVARGFAELEKLGVFDSITKDPFAIDPVTTEPVGIWQASIQRPLNQRMALIWSWIEDRFDQLIPSDEYTRYLPDDKL